MAERKKGIRKKKRRRRKRLLPGKKKEVAVEAKRQSQRRRQLKPNRTSLKRRNRPSSTMRHRPTTPPKFRVPSPKYYGTGRRKESVAKVWLTNGSGKVTVNSKTMGQYFCGRRILEFIINRPFAMTQTLGKYDVYAEAQGGGVSSQAGALSVGIAQALSLFNPDLRVTLRRNGLLTRDPRMKERKKYGLKRARRAFQYTKR